jgi:cysteine synthase A
MEADQWPCGCIRQRCRCVGYSHSAKFQYFTIHVFPGTGGTIAGVGQFIKSMSDNVIVALSDPEGSGLYNKVNHPRPYFLYRFEVNIHSSIFIGQTWGDVRPQGNRGNKTTPSGGYGRRRNVSTPAVSSANTDLIRTYFPRGINRLTNNIELALPIIDDAFR